MRYASTWITLSWHSPFAFTPGWFDGLGAVEFQWFTFSLQDGSILLSAYIRWWSNVLASSADKLFDASVRLRKCLGLADSVKLQSGCSCVV